jgi:hypothetical protein
MNVEQVIDYSYPCMMAERALRDLHAAMLHNDHEEAMEHALTAMTEVKMAYNSIVLMKEKRDALHQVA